MIIIIIIIIIVIIIMIIISFYMEEIWDHVSVYTGSRVNVDFEVIASCAVCGRDMRTCLRVLYIYVCIHMRDV